MGWSENVVPCCFARLLAAGVLLVVCCDGCGPISADRPSDGRLPVFAGIPPLAYLVEQIGGEHVKVDVLVQPGQDPHTFEPSPQQILALGRAAVFFKIDMPFEKMLLEKVLAGNGRLQVVDVTRGIEKRGLDASCGDQAAGEDHGHEGQRGEPDPHVWLSPPLLKIQAGNIAAALCQADPGHTREYQARLAALVETIDATHRRIAQMLAPYRGRSFYVFHPGFGYFADAYGLKEEAVEAGGRLPTPRQLRALVEKARADGAAVVFVQPQYDPQSARVVAEAIGGQIVTIDGLGKDVIRDIEDIATKIENALDNSSPRRHGEHGEDK
jgi:zinc transport system substrate-binding protein